MLHKHRAFTAIRKAEARLPGKLPRTSVSRAGLAGGKQVQSLRHVLLKYGLYGWTEVFGNRALGSESGSMQRGSTAHLRQVAGLQTALD